MALNRYFHKPKPLPLIMSAAAVLLMFGLGIWQLQRLAWKEALIADIEQAAQFSHAPATLPDNPDALRALRFRLVAPTGEYLQEPEFHLAARYFRSQLGYSIFNPFKLEDGRIVLVNRGWVPAARKAEDKHPPAPHGPQTLLAQLRTSHERNPFTPANQPERNVWFGRDVAAMCEHAGLKDCLPVTLDVVREQDPERLPIPATGEIRPRNDHLGYAITWFGIGLAVLVIALLYHRKKPEER